MCDDYRRGKRCCGHDRVPAFSSAEPGSYEYRPNRQREYRGVGKPGDEESFAWARRSKSRPIAAQKVGHLRV